MKANEKKEEQMDNEIDIYVLKLENREFNTIQLHSTTR